ncbi:RNA ligase 2 [Tupanvirus deep ocean]|uniref:RNA ligase 2 n=2 Tax=Tupanvirus TaxID=2094720 RepID=A0AC62AA34_9VIRU|nr:RNA ligase 2 [Tupanvirus deep ocean]QKU34652.1 RNA ligase 2 [Tupanvirus deep ocean]
MENTNVSPIFREFSSIDNSNSKHIKQLEKYGYTNNMVEWVALEKIHGANFSFVTDGLNIAVAKRSCVIPDNENFFNSNIIRDKYQADILTMFGKIKNDIAEVSSIQAFGEIFGGYYPGFDHTTKPVQKGVYYKNEIDFLVFDIKINTKNAGELFSFYLSHDEVCKYLENLPLLRGIPIVARGKFSDIITMSPVFQTTIPTLYNLPEIKDNMAEGYVFKTNQRHPCHRSRPIVKSKNSRFIEVKMYVPLVSNDIVNDKFVEKAIPYCTQNRFNNTISKVGVDSKIQKLQGIFIADVLKDLEKEMDDDLEEFKKNLKKIKEGLNSYLMRNGNIDIWLKEYHEPL